MIYNLYNIHKYPYQIRHVRGIAFVNCPCGYERKMFSRPLLPGSIASCYSPSSPAVTVHVTSCRLAGPSREVSIVMRVPQHGWLRENPI